MTIEDTFKTQFTFESQVLTFVQAYDMRVGRHAASEKSLDFWNSLSEPYQDALLHLMQMACEVLYKDAEGWVPFCLLPYTDNEGAQFVSITSGFMTSDIEAQMDLLVQASEFELEEAKRKLREGITGSGDVSTAASFVKAMKAGVAMGRTFSAEEMEKTLGLIDDDN